MGRQQVREVPNLFLRRFAFSLPPIAALLALLLNGTTYSAWSIASRVLAISVIVCSLGACRWLGNGKESHLTAKRVWRTEVYVAAVALVLTCDITGYLFAVLFGCVAYVLWYAGLVPGNSG